MVDAHWRKCQSSASSWGTEITPHSQYVTHSEKNSCRMKGKADQLQAWSGPEGSMKLRSPVYTTTAQDSGKFVSLKHRPPLPLGNTPGAHFC